MGASSSVSSRLISNIYISYHAKDGYAILLHEELILRNMINFFGPIETIVKEHGAPLGNSETFSEQLSPIVKNIMANSFYIVIYISRLTVGSYYQAIEINNAILSNANIVYIMTDKTYTPLNTTFLKNFVQDKKWLPAYDEETFNETLEELVLLLKII